MRKYFCVILLMLFCSLRGGAQQLVVGTDVMLDAFQTPNLGAELITGERTSISLNVLGNYKPWGNNMKMVAAQPEFRYWFSGRPIHKWFVGLGALASSYDMEWKDKIYNGSALGFGLTFGYVFNLNQRLNLDFHAGYGMIAYRQKEYFVNDYYDDYTNSSVVNAKGYYLLPTRIGISLTYILR